MALSGSSINLYLDNKMARSTFLERQITDAIKNRVEINENELINVSEAIADNDSEIADHESRIASNRTDIEGLSSGSNGLASDIQANAEDIDAIETQFANFSADGAIANSNLAEMAAGTIKGSIDGGSPADLTTEEVRQLLIDDASASASSLWSADKISSEIGAAVTSSVKYKGGYDASSNTPDLTSGSVTGDFYTVTVAGDFLGETVEVGDSLIAEIDGAATAEDWTIVNKNIDLATESTPGIVSLAGDGSTDAGKVVVASDSRLHEPLTLAGADSLSIESLNFKTKGLKLDGQALSIDVASPGNGRGDLGNYGVISPDMAADIAKIEALVRRTTVNRQSLQQNKILAVSHPAIQHLFNETQGELEVVLPAQGVPKDLNFEIIFNETSTSNLICNGTTLIPGDRYEVIYDGVEWVIR